MNWSWSNLVESWAGHNDPVTRACQSDQRFSYGIYVPKGFKICNGERYGLTVLIHGSSRIAEKLKNAFVDFAERTQNVILAPMFPFGIIDPMDGHNYKFLKYKDIRYDEILLSMIDELHNDLNINTAEFLLHGFSGGGQFAHRFFYLHPERLRAVSIGAPGRVTYLDHNRPWYNGVADIEHIFGKRLNYDAMKKVKILLIVGAADLEVLDYTHDETFIHGEGDKGATRVERLRSLKRNYEEKGFNVEMIEVPGVGHENMLIIPYVQSFFINVLGLTTTPYVTTEIGKGGVKIDS